ncbi:MAG TPA: DUF559 domain-containing protein, partial [Pseudonocardia sp.]|nr:DUF559 domain-containing protein [Pseudonocardia sp.]
LARVDLAYPAARLAVEYDGAHHFDRRRAELDRRRDSLLARYGWDTLRLVSDDVGIGLFQTTQQVRDILELRGRAPDRVELNLVQAKVMIKDAPR